MAVLVVAALLVVPASFASNLSAQGHPAETAVVELGPHLSAHAIDDATLDLSLAGHLPLDPRFAFEPLGETITVGPQSRGRATVRAALAIDPTRAAEWDSLVLGVEARGRRVTYRGPDTIGLRAARDSTLAVWLVPVEVRAGVAEANIALHPGARLQFGRVADALLPGRGELVALGREHVSTGVGEEPALLRLASGPGLELGPRHEPSPSAARALSGGADSVSLEVTHRRFPTRLRVASPALAVTGAIHRAAVLTLPVPDRHHGTLCLALQRLEDHSTCSGGPGGGGCVVRFEYGPTELRPAEIRGGLAIVELPPSFGLPGARMVWAWAPEAPR